VEVIVVPHTRVFSDLIFARKEKQVAEAVPVSTQRKDMGTVNMQREPGPDAQIQRNAEQQIDQNC
jgi:hypothetical protein